MSDHGLHRMLQLRRFPLLATIDLDELATIAENLVETTIPAGTPIATSGERLRGVHLILDGHITSATRSQTWPAHHVFGALEVLANRAVTTSAIAATDVRTLELSATDVGEVLEDNFGVLLATLRELASRLLDTAPSPACRCCVATTAPLGLVERLILLRQQLPFASARLQALATLAHASEEVRWPAGTIIARAGEPASGGLVIVDGAARALHSDHVQYLEAGSAIGHLETLAGAAYRATIETTQPVRALRSGASAIFDVLEDHTDVALAMTATFAGALLDATAALN